MTGTSAAILAATSTSKGNPYLFPIIIVALFGLLYFVMIRPQRNRQRQAAQTQNQVMPGQRVRTTAGMYATVVSIDGDDVVLEVAPGVNVRYMRRAIMGVVPDDTGDTMHSDGQVADDTVYGDGQEDGSRPAKGKRGTSADATEDGTATT
jgi:preprotein translocase YajC subunit